MSQEKVEKYKAEKLNRKQTIKKKAGQKILVHCIVGVVIVLFVGLVGYGFYQKAVVNSDGTNSKTVNIDAMDDYLNGLDADVAMATFNEDQAAEDTTQTTDTASGAAVE